MGEILVCWDRAKLGRKLPRIGADSENEDLTPYEHILKIGARRKTRTYVSHSKHTELQAIGSFGGRQGIRTPGLLVANSGENKLRQGATIT